MTQPIASAMFLHGGIILLVGNLCGVPFGLAIRRRRSEDTVRAWRVAHSGITSGGAVIVAIGAALFSMQASSAMAGVVAYSLIISGYGFSVALPLGAQLGYRGLPAGGPFAKRVVLLGNLSGAVGALVGSMLFVWLCLSS